MNWLTGGGAGDEEGWEDDDGLDDLSDQSLEEETSSAVEDVPETTPPVPLPRSPQSQPGSGVALGGGMFMGRLTRFLEAVTNPESEEEDDDDDDGGEGWDDDGLGDLVDDVDPRQEESDAAVVSERLAPPTAEENTSGWDDDLDISFEAQPTTIEEPLNDLRHEELVGNSPAAVVDGSTMPQARNRQISSLSQGSKTADSVAFSGDSGWDVDEEALSDLEGGVSSQQSEADAAPGSMDRPTSMIEESTMPAPPDRQVSGLSRSAPTENSVAFSGDSGWDDDRDALNDDEEVDAHQQQEQSASNHIVEESTMPHPPNRQMSSHSQGTRTEDSVAYSGDSGWDEDEEVLNGLGEEQNELQQHEVDEMPRSHPSHQNSNLSNTILTEGTVANSADTGWDDVDDVLEDLDVSTEGEMQNETAMETNRSTVENQSVSFGAVSTAAVAPLSAETDGWEDDVEDIALEEEIKEQLEDTILDHTPPLPPPPPRSNEREASSHAVSFAAQSTATVAASSDSCFEAEDRGAEKKTQDEGKLVDLTPPPPLPHGATTAASEVAVALEAEDGWDDDDDDDLDNLECDVNDDHDSGTPMVDHTPLPASEVSVKDAGTEAAVVEREDDDISRDDTLSIANSRARYEELQLAQQPQGPSVIDQIPPSLNKAVAFKRSETSDAVKSSNSIGSSTYDGFRTLSDSAIAEDAVVDNTPSVASSRLDRQSSNEESMMVLGVENGSSSISESWDSLSDRVTDARHRSRRMVDMTPSGARYHRGLTNDTSLGVAGHTSIGESLDSIDEADEELGSPVRQPGDEYFISLNGGDVSAPRFSSSITATSGDLMSGIPPSTAEDDEDDSDSGRPLVDHTPLPIAKRHSAAASVEVLSVSSEEGDLGESIVGIDDIKEDLYCNVVDHTPETPNPMERPKLATKLAGISARHEDDTVGGVAENVDVEKDIKADDEMDDESSRGTKTTLEEYENRSLVSTVRLTIPEEKQLVDHVPSERRLTRTPDASTVVFADASVESSRVGDDIANDDDTSPAGFGPIVDHTPSVQFRSTRSVATSIATHNSGLEADLKDDDDLDNTIGAEVASSEGGDDNWEAENISLQPSMKEEKHLVDHVPRSRSRRSIADSSLRVMVDVQDDETQIDTIAEDAATEYGPIVDHTPIVTRVGGTSVAASMATQMAKTDDDMDETTAVDGSQGDGWGNDIPDLEDISAGDEEDEKGMNDNKEPTLVDHVPRTSFSRPLDASTMVVFDPADSTGACDDDLSGTNTKKDARYGPVVDHTPNATEPNEAIPAGGSMQVQVGGTIAQAQEDLEDGGTWFGASTVGGISTVGASGDASSAGGGSSRGGWDEDGDTLDEIVSPIAAVSRRKSEENHLVDHVPDIKPQRPANASTVVLMDPSVTSSHEKEEINGNIDGGSFGAVVDHTPSVGKASHHSITNSMATTGTGISEDIKKDEEMEESTWNEGELAPNEGWDQDEPELEELIVGEENQAPPVVDHVPERPESRPTDASTFVAGDPSEIFSQVDDLGQDESHFGPVVDQLPRTQLHVHASAAGSTIVNIASVAEDDLDIAVERAIDGADPRTEAQEQVGWQETLPNPQSGNDEDSQDREQLVDYVPDEQEEEIPDLVRDGSSEMATVGEKSNMIPADDPKEDEFGPVVDHLPIPEDSSVSQPTLTASPSASDRKQASNPSSTGPNVDSVAPNFSVESKESKDDGSEEDEFGPVVDQLPATSSRASVTPSRGGSTVDALGTVSEVEDDYVVGDGWEDDADLDIGGDQLSPGRPCEDRNLSVKWVDGLNGNNASSETTFLDAEMGDSSSRTPLNETRYYDPELGYSGSVWASANSETIEEDGTPPSTPRRNQELAKTFYSENNDCRICAKSSSADCPCVKRLLAENEGRDGLVGTLKTPEGGFLTINFDKLLETEMTKRRLVEKEFQALRTTIESLKASKDSLVLAGETQTDALNKIKSSNSGLTDSLNVAKADADELRIVKDELQRRNASLEEQLLSLGREREELQNECASLKRDIEVLESRMAQASSSAASDLSVRESELQSEISKWKGSNEELTQKIARFETECENLRGKNYSLYEDLEAFRESMKTLEEEKAAILAKETSANAELERLTACMENHESSSIDGFQAKIAELQGEIASKNRECADLKSQLALVQKRLNASEAERFKQTKEMARVAEDKKSIVSSFENQIMKSKAEAEKLLQEKDKLIDGLNAKLAEERNLIQHLREEKASLEIGSKSNDAAYRNSISEKDRQISALESELKSTLSNLDSLNTEKQKVIAEMTSSSEQEIAAKRELASVQEERNGIRTALDEAKLLADRNEKQVSDYKERLRSLQSQLEQSRKDYDRLQSELSAANMQKDEAALGLMSVEAEREQLLKTVADLETALSGESTASVAASDLKDMKEQLHAMTDRNHYLQTELSEQGQKCAELSFLLSETRAELGSATSERTRLEDLLSRRTQREEALAAELEVANSNCERLQAQVVEMENARKDYSKNESQLDELARECGVLRHELAQAQKAHDEGKHEILDLQSELADYQELQKSNRSLKVRIEDLEKHAKDLQEEHSKLLASSKEKDLSLKENASQLDAISEERDLILQEKKMLEEENEEMLVHFGLLKEDMDKADSNVEKILDEKLKWETAAIDAQSKLQDAQRSFNDLRRSLQSDTENAMAVAEAAKESLIRENEDLKAEVQKLCSSKQALESKVKTVEADVNNFAARIKELQDETSRTVAESKAKEARLLSLVENLEEKNQELQNNGQHQEQQIFELRDALGRSEATVSDVEDLRRSLNALEKELFDSQRIVSQKDGTLEDLRYQLENAGSSPAESAELETLRRTVREMEESSERDRSSISELEKLSNETSRELKKTMSQLSTSEQLINQLKSQLDQKSKKACELDDLKERLRATERRLEQANRDTESFRTESTDLRGRLAALQTEVDEQRRVSQQPTKEPSGESSAEMQSLRQQIEMLKQEQVTASSQTGAREEVIEREVHALQDQMLKKDGEISRLESQLQMLGTKLSSKDKELDLKQQRVDKLSSELEDLRSQFATSHALELTSDEAENAEKMRQQIISLAQALEKSEGKRALAIERLESERQANADSLRRLTESVKRFYSTLSMGDS